MIHPPECPWHRDWHACSCGLFDTVMWDEPDENGKNLRHYLSVEDVLERQIAYAADIGKPYPKTSGTAAELADILADFLAVHWAWVE